VADNYQTMGLTLEEIGAKFGDKVEVSLEDAIVEESYEKDPPHMIEDLGTSKYVEVGEVMRTVGR